MPINLTDGIGTDFEQYADVAAFEADYDVTKTNNPVLSFEDYLGKRFLRVSVGASIFPQIDVFAKDISMGSFTDLQAKIRLPQGTPNNEIRLRGAVSGGNDVTIRVVKIGGTNPGYTVQAISGASAATAAQISPPEGFDPALYEGGNVLVIRMTFDNTTGYLLGRLELEDGTLLYQVEQTYASMIGATGSLGWRQRAISNQDFADIGEFGFPAPVPPPLTRISSSISENAGNISQVYRQKPIDGSYNEVFMPTVDLTSEAQIDFIKLMRYPDVSMKKFNYPSNAQGFEQAYEGETSLSRLENEAPRILAKVSDIAADTSETVATQTAITAIATNMRLNEKSGEYEVQLKYVMNYFFAKCAELYDWFTYEPNPAYHYPVAAGTKELYAEALFIPQTDGRKDTINQVLENITSLAPSLLRQNKDGNLQVLPLYGPDAFSDDVITLVNSDIVAPLYNPKPDPRDSINAAEVRIKGLEFAVGQELFTPTHVVFAYDDRFDDEFTIPAAGFSIPESSNSYSEPDSGIIYKVGRLAPFDGDILLTIPALDDTLVGSGRIFVDLSIEVFQKATSSTTPPLPSAGTFTSEYQQITVTADADIDDTELTVTAITYELASGRAIYFKDQVAVLTATASAGATTLFVNALDEAVLSGDIAETSKQSLSTSGLEDDISSEYTFVFSGGGAANDGRVTLIGRYDSAQNAIVFRVLERIQSGVPTTGANAGLLTGLWFEFQMRFYGKKYTVSGTEITAKFGFNDTDELPAPDQTNTALEKSRSLIGRRSITVTSNYLTLPLLDAQEYAQAIVRHNINPTKLWTINLTPAGMQRGPDLDSIGQLGALPNLSEGIWNRSDYSDAKSYQALQVAETVTLKEFERIYDDEPGLGFQALCDFEGNILHDFEGNILYDFEAVASDGTPTPIPAPADPQPTLPSDIEGFAGISNSTDWTNATVVTVGNLADLKTQAQIDGTAVTPRIVRLTMNITAGGAGDSAFPTTGDYVTIDLNGFTLLGGSAVPDYEDNVSSGSWHPNGFLLSNYSRIINGTLGHFYDGVRLRNSKTGYSVENVRFKYCQDEQVDLFGDSSGNATSRGSLIKCTFESHPTDPTQLSHAVLLQSDSYSMTNTYLTMARCRFEDGVSNRMPLNKSGANVHIYGNLHFDSQSGSGHIGIGGGAEVLAERNVFYDNSTGDGKRVFYLVEGGGTVSAPLNYYMNQTVAGLTSTSPTRLASIPYAYTLNTTRVDVEINAGSSY